MDVTTVADDLIVAHRGTDVVRLADLQPGTVHRLGDHQVRTLQRPDGDLLCRVGTVNDLHFGELDCGKIDDDARGPIQHVESGEQPHPQTMNSAAVEEMMAADLAAVVVKGDLTDDGTDAEFAEFEACYRDAFGDRLHVVRGNHDAYHGQQHYTGDEWIVLPGACVAVLDTVRPEATPGAISAAQLEWLDDLAAGADQPVIVMGHHQQWVSGRRHAELLRSRSRQQRRAQRRCVAAAQHRRLHRRAHPPPSAGAMACGVPTIEVGCVKDFPGTWAEYRVYEGGITQVVHRLSSPPALSWSERCRHLLADFGIDYEVYALGTLEDRCFNIPLR